MSIEELKEHLKNNKSLSKEDKKVMLERAKLSGKISKVIDKAEMTPLEVMTVLSAMLCGMTMKCKQQFSAIGFVLNSMAEYYQFYQSTIVEDNADKN